MNKIVTGYLKVMGLKISTAVLQASESVQSNRVIQQVAISGTMAEQKALGLNRGKVYCTIKNARLANSTTNYQCPTSKY